MGDGACLAETSGWGPFAYVTWLEARRHWYVLPSIVGWNTHSLTMETGAPFTVTIPGDPLGMNNGEPFQYPDRSYGPGCATAVNPGNPNQYVKLQCFTPPKLSTLLGNEGRNTLTAPGLVDLDVSLSKNIPIPRITETFKAQFRADFFNIINRANFTSPNDNRRSQTLWGTRFLLPARLP